MQQMQEEDSKNGDLQNISSNNTGRDIVQGEGLRGVSTDNRQLTKADADDASAFSNAQLGEGQVFSEPSVEKTLSQRQAEIQELGEKIGRKIVFEDTKKVRGFKSDGYYNRRDGSIHIDYECEAPETEVLKHELVHFGETSPLFSAYKKAVADSKAFHEWLNKVMPGDTDFILKKVKFREIIRDNYAKNGQKLSVQEADTEMICMFTAKVLFKDGKNGVNRLVKGINAKQSNSFVQFIKSFITYLKQKFSGNTGITREIIKLENSLVDVLKTAKTDFSAETTKNTAQEGDVAYSIVNNFSDTDGNMYEKAVLLDTDFFEGISPRNWGKNLKKYIENRNSLIMPIFDENGNEQMLEFARKNERVSKNKSHSHLVLSELYETNDNISKLSVIHIDEIVEVSEAKSPYYSKENSHGWLDKNGWLHRDAYVINSKNGSIYNITLDIAKTNDGRHILYATNGKIKKVGQTEVNSLLNRGSGSHSNSNTTVSQVNTESQEKVFDGSKEDMKYSIPTEVKDLLSQYDSGEISREEFLERISEGKGKKTLNPKDIADLDPEVVSTTPPLKRKIGVAPGDEKSNTYDSVLESSIFDDEFKAEVELDEFVMKYESVTNKATLKKAAKKLDEGGQAYVIEWFSKPIEETSPLCHLKMKIRALFKPLLILSSILKISSLEISERGHSARTLTISRNVCNRFSFQKKKQPPKRLLKSIM